MFCYLISESQPHQAFKRRIGLAALLFATLLLSACATGLPVRGSVGGQTIQTGVDSEVARYYLGHYLTGERTDPALDARIDRVYQSANGSLPDREELKRLSDEFSVDFAALYFADQVAHVPINRRFRRAFDQAYEYALKAFPQGRVKLPTDYEVLFVPTYLYKRFFSVGADMAVPRAALKEVEWSVYAEHADTGPGSSPYACPACGRLRKFGHDPACKIGRALGETA